MQKVNGQFFKNHRIFMEQGEIPHCSIVKGQNHVFKFDFESVGSPFRTDTRSLELLLISVPELPGEDEKLELPHNQVSICFLSGGQVVTFKAYEAYGWIQFQTVNTKSINGKMNLSLNNELDYDGVAKQKQIETAFTVKMADTSD